MSHDRLDMIASMATERCVFERELSDSVDYLYNSPDLDSEIKLKNVDEFMKVMETFDSSVFEGEFSEDDWTSEHLKSELEFISGNMGIKVGKVMPMLRVAITGGKSGPTLPEIMYVNGPKETRKRIKSLMEKINH